MKRLKSALIAACCMGAVSAALAAVPAAGNSEEATNRLLRSIDQASEQGNYRHVQGLRLQLAQHYAGTGAYALAARQYELILATRPPRRDRVDYFIELGRMRDLDRDYDRAIAAYEDALHDEPNSWDAYLNLARAYDHAELNSKAIDAYKRCIELKPTRYEAYHEMGHVYQQLGFLNKAIQNYEKALSREKRPETYLALADTYVRQGNVVRAKDVLMEAKALLPLADYDVRLGEIYRRHGDMPNAAAAWEEALKSDDRRDDVRLQLALAYEGLNRSVDADRLFRRLLAAYPQSPLMHFSRAWSLYSRGDAAGARQEALAVQKLAPTPVVQHYNDALLMEIKKKS
jgi:tetratricopeptide (TPR) repeat protein